MTQVAGRGVATTSQGTEQPIVVDFHDVRVSKLMDYMSAGTQIRFRFESTDILALALQS